MAATAPRIIPAFSYAVTTALMALAMVWGAQAMAQIADSADEISFEAYKVEYFAAESRVRYAVEVRAQQGEVKLLADQLDVLFDNGPDGRPRTIRRMMAHGSVAYITPSEVARADRGAYEADTGLIVLTGNVEVTGGPNVLTGDRIAFRPNKNLSLVDSADGARMVIRPTRAAGAVSE